MDKNTLSQLFNATLSQDQNIRMKVELTLKDVWYKIKLFIIKIYSFSN